MGEREKTGPNKPGREGHFVLVVDDDAQNLSFLCMLLARFGYRILKAATVRQALATASTLVPSLVIISLDLPGMDGFKLMRRLRHNPVTGHIPFIGFIRQDNADLKERSFEHGAAGYLCGPFDAEGLYRAVQAAMEKNPRTNMRVRTTVPVKVYSEQHRDLYGAYTLALSTGGLFLRTMNPVSVNSEISLELEFDGHAVAAEAVVAYNCQTDCGESGIGLRFVDIAPRDRDFIRQFINTEVMKNIPPESLH